MARELITTCLPDLPIEDRITIRTELIRSLCMGLQTDAQKVRELADQAHRP